MARQFADCRGETANGAVHSAAKLQHLCCSQRPIYRIGSHLNIFNYIFQLVAASAANLRNFSMLRFVAAKTAT
jgi:hypothetical protein